MTDPTPRRRRGSRRDPEETSEDELVAALRRRTWSWLRGDRAQVPVTPEAEPVASAEAPASSEPIAPPEASGKRRRTKREPVVADATAWRRGAWAWLKRRAENEVKAAPPRKPRVKRETPAAQLAAFRKAAWTWLTPAPAAPPKEAKETKAPPKEAKESKAPAKRTRSKREAVPEAVVALRRSAWTWLQRRPVAAAVPAPAPAPAPEPEAPAKKRRTKREAVPEPVLELRRRAWAWFAPKATGEAAAGTHAPARAPAQVEAVPGGEVVRSHLKGVLEALVFASEHPLPAKELARLAKADLKVVRTLLAELVEEYYPRGFRLDEVAGGFVFRTSPLFAPFVREQVAKKPVKMTRAQIETLAIVAYRQPITRPEIDEVRGVDSGAVLKSLLERELVRILGKKDEPGRPMLYGTTGSFLEFFGLKALGDLPTLREFTELTDESRRTYEREMGEEPPDAAAPPEGLMGAEGEFRRAPTEGAPTATEATAADTASTEEAPASTQAPPSEEPAPSSARATRARQDQSKGAAAAVPEEPPPSFKVAPLEHTEAENEVDLDVEDEADLRPANESEPAEEHEEAAENETEEALEREEEAEGEEAQEEPEGETAEGETAEEPEGETAEGEEAEGEVEESDEDEDEDDEDEDDEDDEEDEDDDDDDWDDDDDDDDDEDDDEDEEDEDEDE
ncbi:Segregation and condensation protein B [Minicystis rosea]|nr:Segregation and condensation protein B [Minicystis rosea]